MCGLDYTAWGDSSGLSRGVEGWFEGLSRGCREGHRRLRTASNAGQKGDQNNSNMDTQEVDRQFEWDNN